MLLVCALDRYGMQTASFGRECVEFGRLRSRDPRRMLAYYTTNEHLSSVHADGVAFCDAVSAME